MRSPKVDVKEQTLRPSRQEGVRGRNAEPSERGSPAAPPRNFLGGTEQKFPFPFLNFFQGARAKEKL